MDKTIQFWYEFASPYSFISAFRIEDLAKKYSAKVIWRPFLLGPIFKKQGWNTSPFVIYPEKGKYMWRDIERNCIKYEIPYSKPSIFPQNSLLVTRVACIAQNRGWCAEFSKAVFTANFQKGMDISDYKTVLNITGEFSSDPDGILKESVSDHNREFLHLRTEEALNHGIFGAPSFIVNGELFWGNDRLKDAMEYTD